MQTEGTEGELGPEGIEREHGCPIEGRDSIPRHSWLSQLLPFPRGAHSRPLAADHNIPSRLSI